MNVESIHPAGPCPSDERLAELIENRLSSGPRPEIERHVAHCSACADVVATAATVALPSTGGASRFYAPELPSRETRRRWPKIALAAGLAIAIMGVAGYAATARLMQRGAALAEARVRARLGVPVSFGTLTVALRPGREPVVLHLDKVRVGSDSADAADFAVGLASLWSGQPEVRLVRLLHPVLHVRASADASAPPVVFSSGSAALADTPVEIVDGEIHVDTPIVDITLANANGRWTPDGHGGADVEMSASLAGGSVRARGTVATAGAGRVVIRARNVALGALRFTRDRMHGAGDIDLVVRAAPGVPPRIAGRTLVRAGAIAGGNPFRALLARSGAAAMAEAPPALRALDLAFDELRFQFNAHGTAWRVPALTVVAPDFNGTATLHGSADALAGTGSLRVAAGASDPLLAHAPALASQLETDGSLILPFVVGGDLSAQVFQPRF